MMTFDGTKVLATPSVTYGDDCALAGVNGSEGGFIHVRTDGLQVDPSGQDRWVVIWSVYGTDGDLLGRGDDLQMPFHTDQKGLQALSSLLSFLLACVESDEDGENYNLFESGVRDWAECYSDELQMIALEVEDELLSWRGN